MDTKDLILGMERALKECQKCDGDLDFAIFLIKRDIQELERQALADSMK